jgi:hypothetical protein
MKIPSPPILAALAGLALSGCATTATPYQAARLDRPQAEGFAEQPIENGRVRITFRGNNVTSREAVEDGMLYRAAEVTLAQGYDWFVLAARSTDQSLTVYGAPLATGYGHMSGFGLHGVPHHGGFSAWSGHGLAGGWHGAGLSGATDLSLRTAERFTATAEVQFRRGTAPSNDPAAYDARSVVEALGPRLKRPPV